MKMRICFNSRTPCGVRHYAKLVITSTSSFQFTHPVWGATVSDGSGLSEQEVSIHAPRVGCDLLSLHQPQSERCFNSRTPCGVRPSRTLVVSSLVMFQFTHPVWGATSAELRQYIGDVMFQFTHPVWGATHHREHLMRVDGVSIHAPRVGCDFLLSVIKRYRLVFQFTHPVWGATSYSDGCFFDFEVSIHAPRVGCDKGIFCY